MPLSVGTISLLRNLIDKYQLTILELCVTVFNGQLAVSAAILGSSTTLSVGERDGKKSAFQQPAKVLPFGSIFFENYINQISLASYGRSFSGAARHAQICGRLAEDRCPALWRPGVEHATCRSQVRRPNHDATEPHTWNDPVQAAVIAWRNAVPFTVSGCWIVRQKVDVYPGGWGGGSTVLR